MNNSFTINKYYYLSDRENFQTKARFNINTIPILLLKKFLNVQCLPFRWQQQGHSPKFSRSKLRVSITLKRDDFSEMKRFRFKSRFIGKGDN